MSGRGLRSFLRRLRKRKNCTIVHRKLSIMCSPQLPSNAHYPRTHGLPWLQRHRLVYMGVVHCGGTFQTPTHYGTNNFVMPITLMISFLYSLSCVYSWTIFGHVSWRVVWLCTSHIDIKLLQYSLISFLCQTLTGFSAFMQLYQVQFVLCASRTFYPYSIYLVTLTLHLSCYLRCSKD